MIVIIGAKNNYHTRQVFAVQLKSSMVKASLDRMLGYVRVAVGEFLGCSLVVKFSKKLE